MPTLLHYNSENTKSKEDGGAILKGGLVNSNQNYLNLRNVIGNYATDNSPYSSSPVELDNLSKKAIVGTFAYNRSRPLTKGTTPVLNIEHVQHDLKTPGTVDMSIDTNIHVTTKNTNRLDTTAIRQNKFSRITGKFDAGYPAISVDNFGNEIGRAHV